MQNYLVNCSISSHLWYITWVEERMANLITLYKNCAFITAGMRLGYNLVVIVLTLCPEFQICLVLHSHHYDVIIWKHFPRHRPFTMVHGYPLVTGGFPSQKDSTLRWRHNDHAGVSNHQPHGCLLNRLFRRKSKKTPKLRVTGLCAGNSPGTGEFPAQMASYAENVSIWWRHHERGL